MRQRRDTQIARSIQEGTYSCYPRLAWRVQQEERSYYGQACLLLS